MSPSLSIRPARSLHPGPADSPASLQSVPAPRISLFPTRSLVPDLTRLSLLVPNAGPRRDRGHGLLAGLFASVIAGAVDGLTSARELPALQAAAAVAHCVALMSVAGLLLGAALEIVLASASRVVLAVRAWRWVARGPRGWFAPDPGLTTRFALALTGVLLVVAPVVHISGFAVTRLHARGLMVALIALGCVASMLLTPFALVLLVAPLRALFERAGRLASPGTLATILALLGTPALSRAIPIGADGPNDDLRGVLSLALVTLIAAPAATLALHRLRRHRRPLSPAAFAVPVGAVTAALCVSAMTLGESRPVRHTVVAQSALSGWAVQALRRATDRDGDGVSSLFGGEDCDDGSAAIHPGARDVPGNGVDENCSGGDARRVEPPGDGHFSADTGMAPGARPSFVLITVDTMRPDHMSAYGYRRPTTPNIDAFARGAARFDDVYTTSPRTLRSLGAIWTGRYPSHIRWGDEISHPSLARENVTLAEILAGVGFATGAFVNTDYFQQTDGFFQGFANVVDGQRFKDDAFRTTREAAAWIAAHGDRPFFTWVHLLEPHSPYRDLTEPRDFGGTDLDRYDEEIARADLALAAVFEAIARVERAHPERPVVTVVTADHGEGLNAHGRATHGFDLHEEAVRVPLIVRAPGVRAGARRALTSLVDLHATVLNFAGIAAGGAMESRSLVAALRDADGGAREGRAHVFAEVTPDGFYPYEQKAMIAPPWTLFWDVRHGLWELYDTARDPRQRRNLIDERPEVAASMREDLLAWANDTWASRRDGLVAAARLPRAPSPMHPLSVRFGDVLDLLGFDLPEAEVHVGGTLRMTLYYRVRARTAEFHTIGLKVLSEEDALRPVRLDASHSPVFGFYRTTEWNAGEYLRDEVNLRVDPRTRPGRMRVSFSVRGALGEAIAPSVPGPRRADIELSTLVLTPRQGE